MWVFIALVLAGGIFHRPLLTGLVRFAAQRAAASQHVHLEFDISGSMLSDMTLRNIRAWPAGRTPVDKISIEEVNVTYSIGGLLRHGARYFITNCEIKNANMVFKDPNVEYPLPPSMHNYFSEDLHNQLFPPVFLIGRLEAKNVNIQTHTPDWDFVLRGANAEAGRGQPGWFKAERIAVPNIKEWRNIEGTAQISDHDLVLENVKLSPDVTVLKLVSTPAPKDRDASHLSILAKTFGGDLSLEYDDKKAGDHFEYNLRGTATKFSLEGLRQFLDWPISLSGNVDRLDAQCSGNAGIPSSWKGAITADINSPAGAGALKLDHGDATLTLANGAATFVSHELSAASNKAGIDAKGKLPDRIGDLPKTPFDGRFQVAAEHLSESVSLLTNGSLLAEGTFHFEDKKFSVSIVANGKDINSEKCDIGAINIKLDMARAPLANPQQAGPFDDLSGHVLAQFSNARLDKYALDSGQVTLDGDDGWLRINATELKRDVNSATLQARWQYPREVARWLEADFDAGFTLSAPNVTAFNAEPNLTGLNGQFEASGSFAHRNGLYDGKFDASGSKLVVSDFTADSLHVGGTIDKSVVNISDAQFNIDPKNTASGSATIQLHKPFDYTGSIQASLSDLAVYNAILKDAGLEFPIGGALTIDWSGSGDITQIRHTGDGQIKLTGGIFGNIKPISAEISGTYSPVAVNIPTLHVLADKTDFKAVVDLHDTQLKIHDVLLQQGPMKLLRGELNLPIDLHTPAKPETIIPGNGRVFCNLASDEINLETLLIQPKQTSPLKGVLRFSINADGPLDNLLANILIRARNLQLKTTPSVAPGNLELNIDFKDNQLSLLGSLQQPAINPFQITGKLPFPLKQILRDRKIDENSPVDLAVKLDKSPVTIIGQLIPQIRYIEGQMGIDVRAAGTIAKPQLSGAATLNLPAIRFKDPDAPAINNFNGSMDFSGNQFTIHRLGGEISGGPFNISGRMLFQKLDAPLLDLRLTAQNALLMRNETLTVRTDADLKIAGMFNAANVTGNVGITKSKFFREVEILPIELPGRPAPKPQSEARMGFSLKPPLANWTFDVAIKTKDPFLIRGNLTNGAAHIDLKLLGRGVTPTLAGTVSVDKFVASLPFSKLNIDYGYVYFSADNPFMPTLDILGSSSLRDYNIRAYISGTPAEPVTVFTSDPPLPQEEIISLLGTGATSQELQGGGDILAGRAAVLLFQSLYQKIFKQKPQETESFITRFQLDPGAVDPSTGKQEINARFKITDQYYLIGDLDTNGDVRGQVRYLLRFR